MSLDHTPESLAKADRILANHGHSEGNGDANMSLVELVGAYFGEVLRRNPGGHWFENIPDNATGLLVNEQSEFCIWCHSIVFKQVENGNKLLAFIYSDAAARFEDWRQRTGR